MSKVIGEMRGLEINNETLYYITRSCKVKEDEYFILDGEILNNCSLHTDLLCKRYQDKIIASNDPEYDLFPKISEDDIKTFLEYDQNPLGVILNMELTCCTREHMGYWCAPCEDRGKFGEPYCPGEYIKIKFPEKK